MNSKNFLPVSLKLVFSCQNASTIEKQTYKWPEGIVAPKAEKKAKELIA